MPSSTAIVATQAGTNFPAKQLASTVNTKKSVITGVVPQQVLGTYAVQKSVLVPQIAAGGSASVSFQVVPTGLPSSFTLAKSSTGQISAGISLHSAPSPNTHVGMPVTQISFGRGAGSWALQGGVEYSGPMLSVTVTVQNLSSTEPLAAQTITFLAQGSLVGAPGA